jgi:hypothetical protein
VHDVFHVS